MNNDDVFLSFAASDRDRVEPALSKLQQPDLAEVHFSSDSDAWTVEFQPGDDFRASIRDRVQSANQVVVFWSAEAAASHWVQYELGMADALDKPITIVQLDQTAPDLPAHLQENIVRIESVSNSVVPG
jgi:hypothetical protein